MKLEVRISRQRANRHTFGGKRGYSVELIFPPDGLDSSTEVHEAFGFAMQATLDAIRDDGSLDTGKARRTYTK